MSKDSISQIFNGSNCNLLDNCFKRFNHSWSHERIFSQTPLYPCVWVLKLHYKYCLDWKAFGWVKNLGPLLQFDLVGFSRYSKNWSVCVVDVFLCHDFLYYPKLFKVSIVHLPYKIVVSVSLNKIQDFIHVFTSLSPLHLSKVITIFMLLMIT